MKILVWKLATLLILFSFVIPSKENQNKGKLNQVESQIKVQVDSLRLVNNMPYICKQDVSKADRLMSGCGDPLFWKVVEHKAEAIPYLLEQLDDSTSTTAQVPYFGYFYTSGDVAYVALQEIIHGIPSFELLGVEFDSTGCGSCVFWQHLNERFENRKQFKEAVKNWYFTHQDQLVWVTSERFSTCDCSGPHPNGGHFELEQ